MIVDETFNPWIEHVAPLFCFPSMGMTLRSTDALRWAMLALGATHLS